VRGSKDQWRIKLWGRDTLVSYHLQTAIQTPPYPSICTLGCSDLDKFGLGGQGGGVSKDQWSIKLWGRDTLVSYHLQTAIQTPPHPSICTLHVGCSDCY
jgi:hypothetical protein